MERSKGKFVTKKEKLKRQNFVTVKRNAYAYENLPERRIVDLRHFVVKLECSKCNKVTNIATSGVSQQRKGDKLYYPYTVNIKAALGMIHAGIGHSHVSAFLSSLGIPSIHHKGMKRMERTIGNVIEQTARDSCVQASEEERKQVEVRTFSTEVPITNSCDVDQISFEEAMEILENGDDSTDDSLCMVSEDVGSSHSNTTDTNSQFERVESLSSTDSSACCSVETVTSSPEPCILNESICTSSTTNETTQCARVGSTHDSDTPVEITVSQDAAWSKRGRAMNSLSGWGHVIGEKTRKCLNFSTRVKNCAKCTFYKRAKKVVPPHDCRKNWSQSSKSMESDIAVTLHKEAKNTGLKYAAVIGDEDSSSIKHIREKVNPNIIKFSDLGHLKRTLRGKLEKLHKSQKSLSVKVRESFMKNFSYAVQQNKSNSEQEMRTALQAIVPHMYGNHTFCGSWCQTRENDRRKHSNLPYGCDLTDNELRIHLENILSPFISNCQKLLTSGSTQANDYILGLNNVAWSKAPKARNYNASESFDYRCAAAVLQFNDGVEYLNRVIENSNLTPQRATKTYTVTKDRRRKYLKVYQKEKGVKRRRIELKKRRLFSDSVSEVKEGLTYKRGCLEANETELDTFLIPDAIDPVGTSNTDTENSLIVFYDLETTSLDANAEIVQVSACTEKNAFNRYILPEREFNRKSSEITGLSVNTCEGHRSLCKEGETVPSTTLPTALEEFMDWLNSLKYEKVILAAHNGKSFDMRLLIQAAHKVGCLNKFSKCIYGFVDTLHMFRSVRKDRQSLSLGKFYERIFNESFDAHNSSADVYALMRLFNHYQLHNRVHEFVLKFKQAVAYLENAKVVKENRIELQTLMCGDKKIVSRFMAQKIAECGLSYNHFETGIFERYN